MARLNRLALIALSALTLMPALPSVAEVRSAPATAMLEGSEIATPKLAAPSRVGWTRKLSPTAIEPSVSDRVTPSTVAELAGKPGSVNTLLSLRRVRV